MNILGSSDSDTSIYLLHEKSGASLYPLPISPYLMSRMLPTQEREAKKTFPGDWHDR